MRVSNFVRATAVLAFSAATAHAQAPVGTFNFGGSVRATAAGPIDVLLQFLGGGAGNLNNITANPGSTGSFAVFNPTAFPPVFSQYTATLQNIHTVTGPQTIPAWLQLPTFHAVFPGVSGPTPVNYSFNLASIAPGAYSPAACFAAPAVGQTCTPPGTGFNLSNTASSSGTKPISATAAISLNGTVVNLIGGGTSNFFGTLTAQFPGLSYQDLITAIDAGQNVDVSFSGTLVASAVPEPATVTLMGAGLLALVGVARRRRNEA